MTRRAVGFLPMCLLGWADYVEAQREVPVYHDRYDLLTVIGTDGRSRPVTTSEDWQIRRGHIRANLERVMGPVPLQWKDLPLDVRVLEEQRFPRFVRRRISYRADPDDKVSAYLLIPLESRGRLPAMMCLHQTTQIGKEEPVGLGKSMELRYALELAERGFVTLAPDYWPFGEYRTRKYTPYEHGYVSGTMKGIWNHMRGIDLLQSLPEVDPERIGCIGHSLGGHNTLWLAALDSRVKVAVTSCGFTSMPAYAAVYGAGDLKNYAQACYMPRVASEYGNDPKRLPWDFPEVLAAIAPRPIFINAPTHDANFDIGGVNDCVEAVRRVYAWMHAEKRVKVVHPDAAHAWPQEARVAAYDFIEAALKTQRASTSSSE